MSLAVSPELLDQARHGDIDDAAFIARIQASLPYAWQLVSGLTEELRRPVPTSPTIRCRRPTRPGMPRREAAAACMSGWLHGARTGARGAAVSA